jgi:hypothetical protein
MPVPAVVSDPSLQPGIVSQGSTIWDYPNTPAPSILNFQSVPSQPQPDRTATATGLLCPELLISERLPNFPPGVWSLSPSSVLVHFMQALMGPAGAGQLRNRQQLARLQSVLTSTSFYDLDSFYGALFGALRGPQGALPQDPSTGTTFSPYTGIATNDTWDSIYSADATFRERIIALARAITLGGTIPGLQAIAEALCQSECDIYQVWSLIDSQGPQGATGNLWSQVQADYPTWSAISFQTWIQVQGISTYGGMGINARNEVIIQPKKNYTSDATGQQEQAADAWNIMRVARTLAPAFAIISVSPQALVTDTPVPITSLWADSEYWEITTAVTPPTPSDPAYQVITTASELEGAPISSDEALPAAGPPFSQSQGTQYSALSSISRVSSQAMVNDSFNHPFASTDYETTVFPGGSKVSWLPSWAVMSPARAATARAGTPVAMAAAPYSGPRVPVVVPG